MSDQPTTGYDKHLADQHADEAEYPPPLRRCARRDAHSPHHWDQWRCPGYAFDELPEDRVRAFVEQTDSEYVHDLESVHEVAASDLRDVLNELDAYRSVVDRATLSALIVLAKPGTVTDTDRKNAAVRIAEIVLGMTDKETDQ